MTGLTSGWAAARIGCAALAPESARWLAHLTREGAREGRLRFIAHLGGKPTDRQRRVTQFLRGDQHAPTRQIGHRRHPEDADEALGKCRAREQGLLGQGFGRPRPRKLVVQCAKSACQRWVAQRGEPPMGMQNRIGDGIAWMQSDPEAWSKDSFLAVHNAWHLALFYLERGDGDAALAAFDGPIHGARSTVVLDMVDASAMLWRLQLRGVDVGARWESVADGWATVAGAGNYAFNDLHAMLAFIGADRGKARQAIIESLEAQAANGAGDIGKFAREVGLPAARGMLAFSQGRYAEAVNLLRGIRSIAHRFGGSHAQRDLLDLNLIEAAIRSDQTALAAALIAERSARRPHSALTRWFERRVRPLEEVARAA